MTAAEFPIVILFVPECAQLALKRHYRPTWGNVIVMTGTGTLSGNSGVLAGDYRDARCCGLRIGLRRRVMDLKVADDEADGDVTKGAVDRMAKQDNRVHPWPCIPLPPSVYQFDLP